MHCQFLNHGLAISYDQTVKPCCAWIYDQKWKIDHEIGKVDLTTWHQSKEIVDARNLLAQDIWPDHCRSCQTLENQNQTSMRINGNHSQKDFAPGDISLEIRPGSTCNFACQTCWPEASSRVAEFHRQAGILPIQSLDSKAIKDFAWLDSIKHRVRETVVLGGEPFYDKNCQRFLAWAAENLQGQLLMFTNGSSIDYDWLELYRGKVILIFSLDAVGAPAEYIRFGTCWNTVLENFQRCLDLDHVEIRANITVSVYNILYLEPLLDLLIARWPDIVTLGYPTDQPWLSTDSIPLEYRRPIANQIKNISDKVFASENIVEHQRYHIRNNLVALAEKLIEDDFDPRALHNLQTFVRQMDQVKRTRIEVHCPDLADMIFSSVQSPANAPD